MCAPSWLRTAQADEQLDRPDRPTDQRDRARRRQLYASSRSRSSFHYIDMGLGWHSVPLVCRSVIETWNDPVGSLAHLASLVSTRANTIQPMFQQREQAPAGTSCPMCIAGPARSPTMNRSAIIGACPALPFPLWRIMPGICCVLGIGKSSTYSSEYASGFSGPAVGHPPTPPSSRHEWLCRTGA